MQLCYHRLNLQNCLQHHFPSSLEPLMLYEIEIQCLLFMYQDQLNPHMLIHPEMIHLHWQLNYRCYLYTHQNQVDEFKDTLNRVKNVTTFVRSHRWVNNLYKKYVKHQGLVVIRKEQCWIFSQILGFYMVIWWSSSIFIINISLRQYARLNVGLIQYV